MLLPDMFDEKVALMGQEEEPSESQAVERGRLIVLDAGQMVTLFTTGPEGRATMAPVEVILDDAKGAARREKTTAAGGKVSIAISAPITSRWRTHTRLTSTTSLIISSYTPRGTRTTDDRSQQRSGGSGQRQAKQEHALYPALSVMLSGVDHGPSVSRVPRPSLHLCFHELC
jgi:hypothetical protein